jgi:hypothetical protein
MLQDVDGSAIPLTARAAGCGWISEKFTKDLLVSPSTRGVTDIAHEVYAVGSRGEGKAKKFVDTFFKEVGAEGAEKVSCCSCTYWTG